MSNPACHIIYKEVGSPTRVDHCVRASLTGARETNLVLARSWWIEIYRIIEEAPRTENVRRAGGSQQRRQPWLQLVGRFELSGNVEALEVVRFPGRRRDSLLLGLSEARLSCVEWDIMQAQLTTSFMYSVDAERDSISPHLGLSKPPLPLVRVHPEGKCVVMLAYQRLLLIFPVGRPQGSRTSQLLEPFRVDLQSSAASTNEDPSAPESGFTPISRGLGSSGGVVSHLGLAPNGLLDLAFLEGYAEPSLVVLHPTRLTWPGRYAVAHNTNVLLTLSLDLLARSVATVSRVERLPHECQRVVPVPLPIGGVLVLGPDSLLHFRDQVMDAGLSLNAFGSQSTGSTYGSALQESEIVLSLDNPQTVWLSPESLLFGSASGHVYLLTLHAQGLAVVSMALSEVGNSAAASCLTRLSPTLCFLGAALGPSVLIEFMRRSEQSRLGGEEARAEAGVSSGTIGDKSTAFNHGRPGRENQIWEEEDPYHELCLEEQDDIAGPPGQEALDDISAKGSAKSEAEAEEMAATAREAAEAEAEYSSQMEAQMRLIFEGGAEELEEEMDEGGRRRVGASRGRQEGLREVEESKEFVFRVVDLLFGTGPLPSFATGHAFVPALHEDEEEEAELEEQRGAQEQGSKPANSERLDQAKGPAASDEPGATEEEDHRNAEEKMQWSKSALRAAVSDVTELVCASGHGADGGLAVIQPGVLAEVVDFSDLDFLATGTWALFSQPEEETDRQGESSTRDKRQGEQEETTPARKRQRTDRDETLVNEKALHEPFDSPSRSTDSGGSANSKRNCPGSSHAAEVAELEELCSQELSEMPYPYHSFLLISSSDSTRVLATGVELQEKNPGGFLEEAPTLAAGNVFGTRYGIVQVYHTGVRLVVRGRLVAEASLHGRVTAACVEDPYVLTRLADGSLCLLEADEQESLLRISLPDLAPLPGQLSKESTTPAEVESRQEIETGVEETEGEVVGLGPGQAKSGAQGAGEAGSAGQTAGETVSAACMFWDREGALTEALEVLLADGEEKWARTEDDDQEQQMQLAEEDEKEQQSTEKSSGESVQAKAEPAPERNLAAAPTEEIDELEALFFGSDESSSSAAAAASSSSSSSSSSTGSSAFFSGESGQRAVPDTESSVQGEGEDSSLQQFQRPGLRLAAVCRRSGLLELYTLPSFTRVFWCGQLAHAPRVLAHGRGTSPKDALVPPLINGEDGRPVRVTELFLACLGPRSCNKLPLLIALLSSGDLLVYRAFLIPGSSTSSTVFRPPQLRFVRVQEAGPGGVPLLRPKQTDKSSFRLDPLLQRRRRKQQQQRRAGQQQEEAEPGCSRFTLFRDLSGQRCVLLTVPGQPPFWIFSPRGWPRFHSCLLPVPGTPAARPLSCATPFHNVNCELGFIAFDQADKTTLFIGRLPQHRPPALFPHSLTSHHTRHPPLASREPPAAKDQEPVASSSSFSSSSSATSSSESSVSWSGGESGWFCLDWSLPSRLVPLGATVHFITAQPASGTYAVVVSRPEPEPRLMDEDPRLLPVTYPAFELLLLSPAQGWRTMARWSDLQPREAVLSCSSVTLEGEEYVLMGTSVMEGEDSGSEGRIVMLNVYWALGMDHTGREMQMLKIKPVSTPEKNSFDKGPVTAVAQLEGFVLTALGPRLRLYQLKEGRKLASRAFCDVYSYVTTLNTLKNFIIFGDITRSLLFGIFDKSIQQLVILGKDLLPLHALSAQFLVDGQALNLVLSAENGNVYFFRYASHLPESQRIRLMPVADFHVGGRVACLQQLRLRGPMGGDCPHLSGLLVSQSQSAADEGSGKGDKVRTTKTEDWSGKPGQVFNMTGQLIGSFLEGGLMRVCPLNEVVFRRLQALHTALTFGHPHIAGLNPREWRLAQRGAPSQFRPENKKSVLDGDLLWRYVTLEWRTQLKLASDIGTTPDQIIDNLRQLDDACSWYGKGN
eukprot:gb/GEZN01000169.1/.p1 GENE.gb/GEZN01000169.1/~~gb/GEZN01000169.1/.p1  ORF type:complete len:1932 (-),score=385.08 gb/GEZN01000169.1/:310-6105(-)